MLPREEKPSDKEVIATLGRVVAGMFHGSERLLRRLTDMRALREIGKLRGLSDRLVKIIEFLLEELEESERSCQCAHDGLDRANKEITRLKRLLSESKQESASPKPTYHAQQSAVEAYRCASKEENK